LANQYTAHTYITDTLKRCSLCGEVKEHADFHKDSKNIYGKGLAYYCKECANSKSRACHSRLKITPEYKVEKRNSYIKFKYDISLDEYLEKLKAQGSTCAICKVKLLAQGSGTHLDHCHRTGKLRAFLCTNCNRGLGHFQDSTENLKSAIAYLASHNSGETE